MKIALLQTFVAESTRKEELERQIAETEEKLKSPERTVEDIVRHIELIKEYKQYL